jgi:hypothetical protein
MKNTLPNEKMSKSILPIYNMGHVVYRKNGLVLFFKNYIEIDMIGGIRRNAFIGPRYGGGYTPPCF